jgi:glycosyltransferase involved in cell wall biosynthesis
LPTPLLPLVPSDALTVVVVPTYDEASNIEALLRRIRAVEPRATVLIVDDSSPDGTADLAEALAAELGGVEVLRRPGKAGIGTAYRAGFAWALERGAAICVQMDADLSHEPESLPALIAAVRHGADLALGSRYVPGAVIVDWPYRRRLLSRWGNRYVAALLGLALNDATSGYRAWSADALVRLGVAAVDSDGYAFQVEMAHRVVRAGGRVVEIPITFVDRKAGRSKLSWRIVGEAWWLVTVWATLDLLRGRRWSRRRS